MRQLMIALPFALIASTTFAAAPTLTPSTIQCSRQSGHTTHTRTVELKSTDAGGCRVNLTRDGADPKEIAHADHQLHVCTDIQQKVLDNLKEAGFTCE